MLRYRYFVRVEQIKENIRSGKADEALEMADSLEPSRIRNNSDLHIIADLYIEKGNYERAQACLTELYGRKKTRGILMQLINLSIRIKNIKDAENYFHEFRAMNPNDYYNYIFRYNLDKVEGKPNEVLIKSLENLKNAEYIEPWAYQLAKLYHKEGRKAECIRECEEIIAWFGYGDYVDRAKALLAYYKGELEIKLDDTLEDAVKKSELEEEFASEVREFAGGSEDDDEHSSGKDELSEDGDDLVPDETTEEESLAEGTTEEESLAEEAAEEENLGEEVFEVKTEEKISDEVTVDEELPGDISEETTKNITEDETVESVPEEQHEDVVPEIISEEQHEDAASEIIPEVQTEGEASGTVAEEDYSDEEINEGAAAYGANTVERIEKDITDSLKEDYSDRYSATLEDEIELSLAAAVIAEIGEEFEPEKTVAEEMKAPEESVTDIEPEAQKPAEYVGHEFKALKAAPIAEGSVLDEYLKKYNISFEEIFGFYAYQKEVRAQLIKALEIQLNPQVRNKCLVISGGRNSGIKKLIRCTAKMLHQAGFLKDYHVANTEAEKVNSIRLSDKLDRLMGFCMVINNAGSLTPEAAAQLPEIKEIMSGKVVVVLTDYRSELNRLFRDNRELNSVFPLRIHIPEFDKDDLEDLVFFKAKESDCRIEKSAFEEIQKELRRLIREGNEGILSEADTFISAVIDSVETRNAKILMSGGIAAAAEAEKTITLSDVKSAKVEEQ